MLCATIVLETTLTYPNFFSALVGLTDSALKTDILICFACSMAIMWTKLVIKVFLSQLDASEVQVMYQRGWIFLCNVILFWGTTSTQIYDNPYNVAVCILSLFVLLVLHWVCSKRVSNMTAIVLAPDMKFMIKQARFASLISILFFVDIGLVITAIQRFRERDYTLATFSFILIDLMEISTVQIFQYAFNMYSAYYLYRNEDEDEWELLKMLTSGLKFLASCGASIAHLQVGYGLGSSMNTYGSLIFRISRLYSNGASFLRALKAKHELDEFTSLATSADLDRDNTCVICRDEMDQNLSASSKQSPRRLGCGHIMHAKCLISWMAQSPSCPTCRQPVKSAVSSFRASDTIESDHNVNAEAEGNDEAQYFTSQTTPDTRTNAVSTANNIPSNDSNNLGGVVNGESITRNRSLIPTNARTSDSIGPSQHLKYSIPVTMHGQDRGVLAGRYEVRFNHDSFYNA